MKAEFEKAKEARAVTWSRESSYRSEDDEYTFKEGADWGYEWCQGQMRVVAKQACKRMNEINQRKIDQQAKIIEELKIKLEAEKMASNYYSSKNMALASESNKLRAKVEEMEKSNDRK